MSDEKTRAKAQNKFNPPNATHAPNHATKVGMREDSVVNEAEASFAQEAAEPPSLPVPSDSGGGADDNTKGSSNSVRTGTVLPYSVAERDYAASVGADATTTGHFHEDSPPASVSAYSMFYQYKYEEEEVATVAPSPAEPAGSDRNFFFTVAAFLQSPPANPSPASSSPSFFPSSFDFNGSKSSFRRRLSAAPAWALYLLMSGLLLTLVSILALFMNVTMSLFDTTTSRDGSNSALTRPNPSTTTTTSNGVNETVTGAGVVGSSLEVRKLVVTFKAKEQTTLSVLPASFPTAAASNNTNAAVVRDALPRPIEFEVVIQGRQSATGQVELADRRAVGPIRLFNPTGAAISLVAGTLIAHNGSYRYRLLQPVYVPASDIISKNFGTADGLVQAEMGGSGGNLSGGLGRFVLAGANGLQVVGLGPIAGGTNRLVRTPSQQDLGELLASLQAQSDAGVRQAMKVADANSSLSSSASAFASPSPALPTTSISTNAGAGPTLPAGYTFVDGYAHEVLNSVFAPSVKEGEEVPSPGGGGRDEHSAFVNGRLTLRVRAYIYSPQLLNTVLVPAMFTNPSVSSPTVPSSATTALAGDNLNLWQTVGVKPVAGGNSFEVVVERPYNQTQLQTALRGQYKDWQGSEAELVALVQTLRTRKEIASVNLVGKLPSPPAAANQSGVTPSPPPPGHAVVKIIIEFVAVGAGG